MTTQVSLQLLELPPKLRIYVKCRMDGMSQIASARAAGAKDAQSASRRWEADERVQKALVQITQQLAEDIGFTRREAHDMLLQAYQNADTAGEQIQAVRALMELHALAKPKVIEHKHEHHHDGQIEHMSTDQLMKLAEMDDLALEGEYEVVDEQDALLLDGPDKDAIEPGYQ